LTGAEARIAYFRQGHLRVVVRDAAGQPIENAQVVVEQTRHRFLFGSNLFGLSFDAGAPAQDAYRAQFTELLNYATLPFYWGGFEYNEGAPDYAGLDRSTAWARDQGLTVKGHPLVWHEVFPTWGPSDPDSTIPLLKARVEEITEHYAGSIAFWDVVNEANNAHDFDNGVGRWAARDGASTYVSTALGWAGAVGHGAQLLYNDFDTSPANERLLDDLAASGSLPDIIGIQSHMHAGAWNAEGAWSVAGRFARFGLPLHFTEVTVLSGQTLEWEDPRPDPWPSTAPGEADQASTVADLYTTWFSHPAVEAITWWDFSDYDSWQNAPAGLVRADMTPKPAYDWLLDAIRTRWWTKATGTTDAAGTFLGRAFLGTHRVSVTLDGTTRTVELEIGESGNAITDLVVVF